nr:Polynucleotidyl transferase, Ribonuclease H fold [Ipomoea batatas]
MLKGIRYLNGSHNNLLERCWKAIKRFRMVEFRHVYREQNLVADALAKKVALCPGTFVELNEVPPAIAQTMLEDNIGVAFQRRVPVTGALDNLVKHVFVKLSSRLYKKSKSTQTSSGPGRVDHHL